MASTMNLWLLVGAECVCALPWPEVNDPSSHDKWDMIGRSTLKSHSPFGAPPFPDVKQWRIEQKLDHFNGSDNRTFAERFAYNTKYFSRDIAFLRLSGMAILDLSLISDCYGGYFMDFAKRFGAVCFLLEQRYIGGSTATSDTSLANLQWFTFKQILADIAEFITWINDQFGLKHGKWIAFGCSYAGALAAWVRLKYPTVVYGAVASSPALEAKVNLFEYLRYTAYVLTGYSKECVNIIHNATGQIEKRIEEKHNVEELSAMFNTCTPCNFTDHRDVSTFFSMIFTQIAVAVQNSETNQGLQTDFLTVKHLCDSLIESSEQMADMLKAYAKMIRFILEKSRLPCMVCSYKALVQELQNEKQPNFRSRLSYYQRATETGYSHTSDAQRGNPFSHKFDLQYFLQMYQDIFGQQFDRDRLFAGAAQTNQMFGGKNLTATRVIVVNGDRDPWCMVSITCNPPPGVEMINIRGNAFASNFEQSSLVLGIVLMSIPLANGNSLVSWSQGKGYSLRLKHGWVIKEVTMSHNQGRPDDDVNAVTDL